MLLVMRGVPQAYKSYKEGHSEGLSPSMLWLWLGGSICIIPQIIVTFNAPLIAVYFANIIFVSIMLRYLYWPRSQNDENSERTEEDSG
jgi:membrane protein implicated in regulation of membrane protease activity